MIPSGDRMPERCFRVKGMVLFPSGMSVTGEAARFAIQSTEFYTPWGMASWIEDRETLAAPGGTVRFGGHYRLPGGMWMSYSYVRSEINVIGEVFAVSMANSIDAPGLIREFLAEYREKCAAEEAKNPRMHVGFDLPHSKPVPRAPNLTGKERAPLP